MNSTCMLPPISDLFNMPERVSSNHHHHHQSSYPPSPTNTTINNNKLSYYPPLKAKRKRASPTQLSVLNRVFNQTYFPSTELRIELGKQLGMSPRTVQIWFQNKRQSLRTKSRRSSLSSIETTDDDDELDEELDHHHFSSSNYEYMNKCPSSPTWSSSHLSMDHSYHQHQYNNNVHPIVLPPPSSSPFNSYPKNKINLPPLRLPYTSSSSSLPPSPPSSAYPSPISIDSILH